MGRHPDAVGMVAILTGSASERELPIRTPWIGDRSAVSVDVFRVAVGSGLFVHFVKHVIEAGPPRAQFAGGAVLSALVALGVFPRVSGVALYVLSIALYRNLLPAALLDDYVANVAALVLVLLPIGRSLCPLSPLDHKSRQARVPGAGVLGLMAVVLLLYGLGGIASFSAESTTTRYALRTLPWVTIAYLVPLRRSATVGCLVQIGVHAYLAFATASPFTNAFLAATTVFFWGERRTPVGKVKFDFGAVLQVVGMLVVAMCFVATVSGFGELNTRVRTLLSDAGLLPLPTNQSSGANPKELASRAEARPNERPVSQ